MEKLTINRRRIAFLRLFIAVLSVGSIIHLTHWECARNAHRPLGSTFSAENNPTAPPADQRVAKTEVFHATAYCISGITKSGVLAAPGLVSADPKVIPLGSMIYIESPWMSGVYQVLDTGDLIKGKIIDIFIPSYEKCVEFGRRAVKVKVLRYGFHGDKSKATDKPAVSSK